jgi:hypothetical protein
MSPFTLVLLGLVGLLLMRKRMGGARNPPYLVLADGPTARVRAGRQRRGHGPPRFLQPPNQRRSHFSEGSYGRSIPPGQPSLLHQLGRIRRASLLDSTSSTAGAAAIVCDFSANSQRSRKASSEVSSAARHSSVSLRIASVNVRRTVVRSSAEGGDLNPLFASVTGLAMTNGTEVGLVPLVGCPSQSWPCHE